MHRHEISQDHWEKIEDLLPGRRGGHGGVAHDNRNFINAVWYIAKTGVPWRDLPDHFGKWDTVYHRVNEWCKKGRWEQIFAAVQDPDLEWLLLDSTVVRAHVSAAGMNTDGNDQDLGHSRGGFSTKIHLATDALGNPVEIHLSPGQDADIKHADTVCGDHEFEALIADKGYDCDEFIEKVQKRGAKSVIPPRKHRKEQRDYDKHTYKERSKIEQGVGLLKQCRRVATRYEKTARNFLGFVLLAATFIWLR